MPQRRPTGRMLHDVIVLVAFFHKNQKQNVNNMFFSYLFPPEGNFDIDAGDGGGGGGGGDHSGPNDHNKSQKQKLYENCSHFWTFSNDLKQKNTPNPINILKITISKQSYPKYKNTLQTVQHIRNK